MFIRYKDQWSSETLFWIWNTKGFVGNEGLHILIPFALSVPTDGDSANSPSSGDFYVHKPSDLVPRRPSGQQALWKPFNLISVQQYVKQPDSLNKNNMKESLEQEKEILLKESNTSKKRRPKKETQREEMVLSIPNLSAQENAFPSILYCKVHQSCRVVHLKSDSWIDN